MRRISALVLALAGGVAVSGIALHRHEPVNALWIVTAAVCIYLLGYRFYAAWIATRVLRVDPSRATPAERLNNGRDFVPTHRAIVFGHHFAAIAGPGPLVGPTLAAQFGYLPGTLWITRRRGARRLCAGHDDPAAVDAPRRPQSRADGAR